MFDLGPSWQKVLSDELKLPYVSALEDFVTHERSVGHLIYPPKDLVFNAFKSTPYEKVRVVLIGQDPYHGPGQAHGLCFSVPPGVPYPPSLRNIIKELKSDLQIPEPPSGCLQHWAEQGVLLLNATLTVRDGSPLSHHGKGWEKFTDAVVAKLLLKKEPLVFMLWGKSAQVKCKQVINSGKHAVLTAPHPSPLSAHQGFLGCKHFLKANELLMQMGEIPIDWSLA
jgi:uracil-DNA glycosylase